MNEIIASKRHNFDEKKQHLNELINKTANEMKIDNVPTDCGPFKIFNHKVTGEEFNERLVTIQKHFIAFNETNANITDEFRAVYDALDILDKDYIESIVCNVKAIEKTSNDVRMQQGTLKQHNEKLADQQSKLDAHQTEIEKNVANISKIVTALKVFKEKLEDYKHLTDIDKIWSDCQKWHQEMSLLSNTISTATKHNKENAKKINALKIELTTAEKTTKDLSVQLSAMIKELESIAAITNELEQTTHLKDVDEMWNSLSDAHDSLKHIRSDIEDVQRISTEHQKEINKLASFMDSVSSLEHIMDIDRIWTCTEEQELHLKEIDRLNNEQTDKLDTLAQENEKIACRLSVNDEDIKKLNDDIKKFNSIAHLEDTDCTWNTVNEHSEQLIAIEKNNNEIIDSIQKGKEDTEMKIAAVNQETSSLIKSLTKKVKYAYWIAGGSAVLAVIELILLVARVI